MKETSEILEMMVRAGIPHTQELSAGFAKGEIVESKRELSADGCSCAELLGTYRFRSRPPNKENPTELSLKMRQEAKNLADRLEPFKDSRCHILGYTKEPNETYAVFLLHDFSEVIGCTWGIDARKTPTKEWEEMWGIKHEA